MDSMDIKKLKNFVLEKKLVEQTIEGFWKAFNYWKIEYPKEFTRAFRKKFDPTNLELYINDVSLRIRNWPDEDFNEIIIFLGFDYSETTIGEYKMLFDPETGEIMDDIFHITGRV
ncbi:hypothetical protein [Bacillus sp. SJS]|uniref:hypothetical protein n=1 Tax=Bacillus sp. SJS TaxID=1423321 RepID=UPI0004DD84F6|nr:hypothetical protein [Bacillus sp. SJS]KZZ85765.1 hypothetical protein AS29_004025 [Bacillus sp. SJS]